MVALRQWWDDLIGLLTMTGRTWWRLLPQLLGLQLFGWIAFQATLRIDSIFANTHPWWGLILFALGLLCVLIATVLSLRLVGNQLGVRDVVREYSAEAEGDARDRGITHMLAITLLPFLGIYGAFGYINSRAEQLSRLSLVRVGLLGTDITEALSPLASRRAAWTMAIVIVGCYLLRRGLDLAYEKTEIRAFGLVATFIECFFLLTLIMGGSTFVVQLLDRFTDTRLWDWLATLGRGLTEGVRLIGVNLPLVVREVGDVFAHVVWPLLVDVLSEPIAWLGVAALVFGSHALSVADLWRQGQTPGADLDTRSATLKRLANRRSLASNGLRRGWLELQEIVLGDIDDKYLPTLQSLRLVVRAGLTFLGAFILVYTLVDIARDQTDHAMALTLGGHAGEFWLIWEPVMDLFLTLVFEPLRLCLLAVAFHHCLLVFRDRALQRPARATAPAAAAPHPRPAVAR